MATSNAPSPTAPKQTSKIWVFTTVFLGLCTLSLTALSFWLWGQVSETPEKAATPAPTKQQPYQPTPIAQYSSKRSRPLQVRGPEPQVLPATHPDRPPKMRRPAGNLFSAKRGAKASGCNRAELLNDGKSNYDSRQGFAEGSIKDKKSYMQIELSEPQEVNRVKFLFWAKDQRQYRYILSVSSNGKDWKVVKDASKKPSKGWQDIRFEAGLIKFVRLKGVGNTANESFHVVEMEGYSEAPERKPTLPPIQGTSTALKPGLWAEYYDGIGRYPTIEDYPLLARPEPTIRFANSTQPRVGWPLGNACGAIFSGYIKIEKGGTYIFFSSSDDGSMLYIDDKLVVDNDGAHGMEEKWGDIDLTPGYHPIWLKYYNGGGSRGLQIKWQPKGDDKTILDEAILFHRPRGPLPALAQAD